jgi:mono/diheme cytochrome c family protein
MIRCVVFVLVVLAAGDAWACNRCGLFGNRCRYYASHSHVAVAPVVVKSPDVFVVQNNYPQPNGAALLAQQGGTVYGYQAAALGYQLNPEAVLRQAADLARGAQSLAQVGLDGYNQSAGLALQLNASIQEPLARGVAASAVLSAAGLNQQRGPSSQTLRISQDAAGKWQVEHVDPRAELHRRAAVERPADPNEPATASIINVKCGQCHGLDLAEPKGGLYFGPDHRLDCATALKAVRSVRSGKMPKGQQLSADERESLVAELLALAAEE